MYWKVKQLSIDGGQVTASILYTCVSPRASTTVKYTAWPSPNLEQPIIHHPAVLRMQVAVDQRAISQAMDHHRHAALETHLKAAAKIWEPHLRVIVTWTEKGNDPLRGCCCQAVQEVLLSRIVWKVATRCWMVIMVAKGEHNRFLKSQ